ncbi:MAG: hypothetical protein JXA71_15650 [Chitinispirillaceae bacterium]|nr:hypothetical protein [Chitinispirillaceae bacterium]
MNLHKMKLHDSKWIESLGYTIIRVPGGWIYSETSARTGEPVGSGTFVPYSDEFMEISNIEDTRVPGQTSE